MVFSRSITFDGGEAPRAVLPAPKARALDADGSAFVDKLRDGDSAAFDLLVDRYSGDIYALLYRLTENPEEAAELVQETFLKAYRSIRRFRGDAELRTWLYRIAVNESRNRFRWWKRRKRESTISLDATIGESEMLVADTLADNAASPEQATLVRERRYALQAALSELPAIFREAIILCDIEGLSYDETASALSISIGTVKSRISRGREELRRKLKGF